MKTTLLTSLCSLALALAALGQSPTTSPKPGAPGTPVATPAALANPAATVAPSPAVAMSPKDAGDLESRIEKKVIEAQIQQDAGVVLD